MTPESQPWALYQGRGLSAPSCVITQSYLSSRTSATLGAVRCGPANELPAAAAWPRLVRRRRRIAFVASAVCVRGGGGGGGPGGWVWPAPMTHAPRPPPLRRGLHRRGGAGLCPACTRSSPSPARSPATAPRWHQPPPRPRCPSCEWESESESESLA